MDNLTVRNNLAKNKCRPGIDLEKVYSRIDSGMTVTQAAESLGVSKATLYRRHREYQKQAEYMNDDLPDLPT